MNFLSIISILPFISHAGGFRLRVVVTGSPKVVRCRCIAGLYEHCHFRLRVRQYGIGSSSNECSGSFFCQEPHISLKTILFLPPLYANIYTACTVFFLPLFTPLLFIIYPITCHFPNTFFFIALSNICFYFSWHPFPIFVPQMTISYLPPPPP